MPSTAPKPRRAPSFPKSSGCSSSPTARTDAAGVDMEWISDPTVWVGFLTLVFLEVVLGVDNLIFIAILSDKLPPEQRDRARIIGLSLALLMRLGLLASITWVMSLTTPLFSFWRLEIS